MTNPAIDPLRENLVMSLDMYLGKKGTIFGEPTADNAAQVKIDSPVINEAELDMIKAARKTVTLPTLYDIAAGPQGLEAAIKQLSAAAEQAVKDGAEILVLSDFEAGGIKQGQTYIPPLLAVGAVHQHLLKANCRLQASIVAETAQAWSTHHVACLVGFGASAVLPYAAYDGVRAWHASTKTKSLMDNGKIPAISVDVALDNYRESVDAGLFKIMSKIGISLLSSYHAAQIFEAIGIGADAMEVAFKGCVSRIGGMTLTDIANEVASTQAMAFPEAPLKALFNYGYIKFYTGKEYHHNAPPMTKVLHTCIHAPNDNYARRQLHKAPCVVTTHKAPCGVVYAPRCLVVVVDQGAARMHTRTQAMCRTRRSAPRTSICNFNLQFHRHTPTNTCVYGCRCCTRRSAPRTPTPTSCSRSRSRRRRCRCCATSLTSSRTAPPWTWLRSSPSRTS